MNTLFYDELDYADEAILKRFNDALGPVSQHLNELHADGWIDENLNTKDGF